MSKRKWVVIPVKPETRELLKKLGTKDMTYDDVIQKLIEKAGGKI